MSLKPRDHLVGVIILLLMAGTVAANFQVLQLQITLSEAQEQLQQRDDALQAVLDTIQQEQLSGLEERLSALEAAPDYPRLAYIQAYKSARTIPARSGPGGDFPRLCWLDRQRVVPVFGEQATGGGTSWMQVACPDGQAAFISGNQVVVLP